MKHYTQLAIKRIFDIFMSVTAVTLLSPSTLLIYLAIRFTVGPPVLFRQPRLGYQGHPFSSTNSVQ